MGHMLYLECNSGISGDMMVGALLDLGADRKVLEQALSSLKVEGYHLHFGRTEKCGISAYDFDVHLEEDHQGEHSHDHACENHTPHDGAHGHSHSHPHDHEDSHHSHPHTHSHMHRNLYDIYEIIDRLQAGTGARNMAKRIFEIVAEAESKAHNLPIDQVHFHEVGAVDSIVDIVSTAVCLENLDIDQVIVSSLAEGHGYVKCQHGTLPVPVPATLNIVQAYGLVMRNTENEGEMVTPTGAAIAAAIRTGEHLPSDYRILKTGIGAGNKDFKQANILRAMLISPQTEEAQNKPESQKQLLVLETNIDDGTGEMMGYVMEELMEAGALDVWYTPVYMKKNRPAYLLSVLGTEDGREKLEDIIFSNTTTIGIRRYPVERTALMRRTEAVTTEYGEARVKICTWKGRNFCYPEYESVKALCRQQRELDFQTVFEAVKSAAGKTAPSL